MPPVLECAGQRRGGPSEGLGRHGPRQSAGRVRLPGRDRWRADTPDCTWSRNVEDDRRTCGLEPSPVSSGRTMTGMCVQSITTLPPLTSSTSLRKFQSTKKQKVKCGKISEMLNNSFTATTPPSREKLTLILPKRWKCRPGPPSITHNERFSSSSHSDRHN